MRKTTVLNPFANKCSLILSLIMGISFSAFAEVFYATPLNGYEHQIGNMLEWSTSFENNSQMFVVEKSIDGIEYENIGVVNASGESDEESSYRFMDINSTKEKAFYRLRQMDTDGTGSFSQTILIKRNYANQFMVVAMSNTNTSKEFKITLDAVIDGIMEYEVYTLNEELVMNGEVALEFGLNNLNINFENEREGAYRIRMKLDNEHESLLIRKVNSNTEMKENVASKRSANGG